MSKATKTAIQRDRTTPKKKKKGVQYTKRFMTKLQSTIAYGVYDSENISGSGDSVSQMMLTEKMAELYFPCNDEFDPRVLHVELFLGQEQKYKFLFEEGDSGKPTIPEKLHQMNGNEISIEPNCINPSMLTRKNLSNPIDISPKTLWRHAKDVEANTKKAFALCMSDSSPYKDFNGTFASGTTWDTYIEWVRVEMFKALEKDKTFEVEVDDDNDPDEMPSISLEDAEEEAEETDADTTVDENEEVPYDWMFKGFIAFALWGHIPIPGGEKYKSGVICAVAGETKNVAGCTRKDSRKRKIENTNIDRVLDRRGVKDVSDGIDKQLAELLFKGRLETQR